MNPLIQSKNTTILPVLIALMLACFALSPQAWAICQQGCLTSLNTVLGDDALLNNRGLGNTAIGDRALFSNTDGKFNTATGKSALIDNTTGIQNTANGYNALLANTIGNNNTANGFNVLFSNDTGSNNTANGFEALFSNTIGDNNTATGASALFRNNAGNSNTAIGSFALANNTTGGSNIALGFGAGRLTTGSSNIDIGNVGVAEESSRIRIGTAGTHTGTFIAGISGVTVPDGVGVIVGANGQLGTVVSSERFKEAIKPMEKASEAIHSLKPVTFRYKQELDPEGIPQFGLVAEEVEKLNPDLVARDAEGKAYTVRYEAVNAMLLNEFLKEHRKVEGQQKEIDALKAELREQKALIEKVSAHIDASRRAQQTVVSNP